ncbi:MAG: NAD-dependent protein deacylase [Clostridia bacterium]|nr:NAD-dependent protein deacylase [Clostridia bacterium]
MYTEKDIRELQKLVKESRSIVFFGGAGVSTESGIPDFRSADGLYSQLHSVPPEVLISHSYYLSNPEEFFDFYKSKMLVTDAKPNKAHLWLAEAERAGRLKAVVTQNIDGLHQAAGSKTVYELHGSVHRNYCQRCGKFWSGEQVKAAEGVPRCECGGIIKPDVVLYEEGLDDATVRGAINAIRSADMLLVAGTSLTVYPAAGFLNYYRGNKLVLINRDPTPADEYANLVIHGKVGEVLSQIEL